MKNLKINNALISVSDKSNLEKILRILKRYKINIISSEGTFGYIKKLGYKCTEISKFTNFQIFKIYKITNFQNLQIYIFFKFKFSNFQNFKISKFQNFQTFKFSNFQNFKISKFQNFKITKFQIFIIIHSLSLTGHEGPSAKVAPTYNNDL